ncbi:MAG: carbon starvation protein A [Anaerolineales bacterium]|nr:carbon starvation protein A [Anaerolineales bacterium]
MNALVILIIAAVGVYLGYGLYAKKIDKDIIQPSPDKATPATMYMDGVDFTPASKNVLFGYQFKSIAALGPIGGPIVAAQYGWLPGLLWIIFGTFFIGWVQDYASIIVPMRSEGDTFGALSYKLISPRARGILLVFIYLYLLLIMGAFGQVIGINFLSNPGVPVGVLAVILMGLLAGQMTYKMKQDILLTTAITVVVAFIGIWVGTLSGVTGFFEGFNASLGANTKYFWALIFAVICYLGAVLPIWRWAQPTNYVSFWIIALGMAGGVIGMIIWTFQGGATFGDFPAFTGWSVAGLGPLWPILFVTIACGAVSGWHSLVSSSGTARQIEKEVDALPIGGGAMWMEMILAVIALLTATAATGGWDAYLEAYAGGKFGVFAVGLANFLSHIGIPTAFGIPYGMVFLTIMGLTICYLVVRFMRVASAELLGDAIPALKNMHVGAIVALVLSLIVIWTGVWQTIWVLFGGANQMMASLALLIITVWLMSQGKKYGWTFWPFVFMYITTIAALVYTAFWKALPAVLAGTKVTGNIIAVVVAVILILCALVLGYDGVLAINRYRKGEVAPTAE